jgi:hypothetical protein
MKPTINWQFHQTAERKLDPDLSCPGCQMLMVGGIFLTIFHAYSGQSPFSASPVLWII